jgi:fructose-specific phosphotransferase system IIA component
VLLSELLVPERIKVPLESTTKEDLLRELVQVLGNNVDTPDLAEVLRAVREREEILSTGIGNGVAIPHGKSAAVASLAMVAGVTREAVDFEALDGQPVKLFFLLIGPESAAGQHVKVLSRISRLLRRDSFRQRLSEARSSDEFYLILREGEDS